MRKLINFMLLALSFNIATNVFADNSESEGLITKGYENSKAGVQAGWQDTKDGTQKAWNATKQGTQEGWEATKSGTEKGADWVDNTSENTWNEIK